MIIMPNHTYIGYLLYRAYIDSHHEVKDRLQLCGQAYLGLAFNLPSLSPITGLIIQYLEPEYIIYLILTDKYNLVKDPLFSHMIHLNNMIEELTPHLRCRFCAVKNAGRSECGVLVGAGCEHYKLDCSIGNITCSDDAKNLVKRYYPSGENWMVDWEVYTTIGNIIQDNGRGQSWSVRTSGGADGGGSSIEMDIIKNYFYTYYYWWSADDYNTFIQTCSKIIV
jgi:hypothetical protein